MVYTGSQSKKRKYRRGKAMRRKRQNVQAYKEKERTKM